MLDTFRRRVLPLALWCTVMGTAGWLWWDMRAGGTARGYVEGIAYDITAIEPGRIAQVAVVPGQRVRPGQLIATLDGGDLDAQMLELDAQWIKVEAELAAAAAETQLSVGESSREIEESVDSADLAAEQARAQKSVAAAELAALDKQIDAVRELVDKRMADRRDLAELAVEQAALRKQTQVADGLIRRLDAQAAAARSRRDGVPGNATVRATAPLRAKLDVIAAQRELLGLRKQSLTLRAPGAGEVSAVLLQAGEAATAGAVVATITGPAEVGTNGAAVVFVCASETEAASISVGEKVSLSPADGGPARLSGHVARLAPAVATLPERCWADPRFPLIGRGIYVAIDGSVALLPGQSFAIDFTGEVDAGAATEPPEAPQAPEPIAAVTPAPARAAEHDRPVTVPVSLRARTRFEPSAIVWSAPRDRYIVVSDDTGFEDVDEHAPWLFTMSIQGVVDEHVVRIDGVDKLNDLESIAPAPDGGLYLLSSQSRSKKGKRSEARQFFGHVSITATEARVTASLPLAARLEGDTAIASALGLGATTDLDIEGMTRTSGGGLLLGLKSPVSEPGAAIWHMADPDRFLATGLIADAGLSVWGHVSLSVTADGIAVPGGIAELLELPDGRVVLAATAAVSDEPRMQDGALYSITGAAGAGTPTLLRTFTGLKPEGLALAPDGESIAIVFDTGEATPRWMEHRWSAP